MKLAPRSKAAGKVGGYSGNGKSNPFGAAKPRVAGQSEYVKSQKHNCPPFVFHTRSLSGFVSARDISLSDYISLFDCVSL
jgi:hypothetical protein